MALKKSKIKKEDTYSYKGWLNSDSFWKRAFAISYYSAVGQLTFILILVLLLAILWFVV